MRLTLAGTMCDRASIGAGAYGVTEAGMLAALSRVAALYDIHGNVPALDAVVAEVRDANVDRIVVGGDVLPGPMPRETLERLQALDIPTDFIYGNGEVAVLDALRGSQPRVGEAYRAMIAWNAGEVTAQQNAIAAWPATITLVIGGVGRVLFCHATPRNEDEIFTRLTPDDRLRPMFDAVDADVVVCGHTHMQFDRTIGRTRVVNAGSVGMPFGSPGAYWLLIAGGLSWRRTAYDTDAAAVRIAATNCPDARTLFAQSLLTPPAEADMLIAYTAAQLT